MQDRVAAAVRSGNLNEEVSLVVVIVIIDHQMSNFAEFEMMLMHPMIALDDLNIFSVILIVGRFVMEVPQ